MDLNLIVYTGIGSLNEKIFFTEAEFQRLCGALGLKGTIQELIDNTGAGRIRNNIEYNNFKDYWEQNKYDEDELDIEYMKYWKDFWSHC